MNRALQFSIRSENLKNARGISESFSGTEFGRILRETTGNLAQFTVVVDANAIISDLILLQNRKNPEATPALLECLRAGTVSGYVTRRVIHEVERHIPDIEEQYKRKKWNKDTAYRDLAEYKKLFTTKTPRKYRVDKILRANPVDPDDAPTIALAREVKAIGILTDAPDLEAMGGFCLEVDFVLEARVYSRKIVVSATIKQGSIIVLFIAAPIFSAVPTVLSETGRQLASAARDTPRWVKLGVAGIGVVFLLWILLDEKRRRSLISTGTSLLSAAGSSTADFALGLFEVTNALQQLVQEHDVPPPVPRSKSLL